MGELLGPDFGITHLGRAFWQNSPLEYVKSVRRSGTARGRHVPAASQPAHIPHPERSFPTVFQHDYNMRGMPTLIGHDPDPMSRSPFGKQPAQWSAPPTELDATIPVEQAGNTFQVS